jgi:hypothetical protein
VSYGNLRNRGICFSVPITGKSAFGKQILQLFPGNISSVSLEIWAAWPAPEPKSCAHQTSRYKVKIAVDAAAHTREFARQLRFGTSGKGSCLFVPDVHPFNFLVVVHSVDNAIERVPHHAINALDARCNERFH